MTRKYFGSNRVAAVREIPARSAGWQDVQPALADRHGSVDSRSEPRRRPEPATFFETKGLCHFCVSTADSVDFRGSFYPWI